MGAVTGDVSPPTGTVTFLFTDVEGSTRLWSEDADAMSASLSVHDEILRDRIAALGGYVFTTAGDSFCAAFGRPSDALAAAAAIQAELLAAPWPGPALRVRMGLHLGEAEERNGDYFGPVVNTAARVEAAGHGGQVLITEAVRLAAGVAARDLGVHALRDVAEPVRLHQVGDGQYPALRVSDPGATNLPTATTSLVGRDTDVRAVRELLLSSRLVTLTAGGGTGKTRLALAVGDLELPHRADGVWFVDLSPVADGEHVNAAVAAGLELSLLAGDSAGQIAEYLSGKDLLLIVDNCEHVVDECAELIDQLIAQSGEYSILATSRERLELDGEVTYQVHPLSTTDESGAVELFRQRAAALGQGFELIDANREQVIELCVRLDGVPLAIELAAARSAVMSPGELLAGIRDRFQLLHGGRRRQRQRTLEATLDWSYDLLEDEEQRVFRALGVFAGSFDAAAVGAVGSLPLAAAVDVIESLIAKSLIVRTEVSGSSRYRLFETTAAYAERRLADASEGAQVRDRHLEHYVAESQQFPAALYADLGAQDALGPDKADLVAAIDWAASCGRWDTAADLLVRAYTVFYDYPTEGIDLTDRCREHVEDTEVAMLLTSNSVILHLLVVDFLAVRAQLRRLRESSSPSHQVSGYAFLAVVFGPSDGVRSEEILARAFEIAATVDPGPIAAAAAAMCEQVAGALANLRLQPAKAREHDARARVHHDEVGYRSDSYAHMLLDSAVSALMLDDHRTALEAANEYLGLSPPFGTGHEVRALAHLAGGDLDAAAEAAQLHVRLAITGRRYRQATDSLLVLAALAASDDRRAAVDLLLGMGQCLTAELTSYARHLANQLGVSAEFEESQRPLLTGTSELIRERAIQDMNTLREEVVRHGWL